MLPGLVTKKPHQTSKSHLKLNASRAGRFYWGKSVILYAIIPRFSRRPVLYRGLALSHSLTSLLSPSLVTGVSRFMMREKLGVQRGKSLISARAEPSSSFHIRNT